MSRILFPRAFAFAVDDLGWNEGSDLSLTPEGGPHRAGVKRTFDLADYESMVAVGKAVGARIQCLFILCEFDRENVLAAYPTTTYQREKWDNNSRTNEYQKMLIKYVREQAAYMEFGLHGTGHEYWAPGEPQKRAEWYNKTDKQPWPEQSLRGHIDCFKKIMAQYGLTPEQGHSFPESFVPCAYSYYWNPTGNYSLGKLLTEAGVKYANTDFAEIPELNPPTDVNGGGFDFGTHVINRINYGNIWYEIASLPTTPPDQQGTDVIESHWPNWLAQDDFLQPEITARWIEYYRAAQRSPIRYIVKNTEQLHSQWLYKKYTVVSESDGVVDIDNTKMPDEAYKNKTLGNMVLKIALNPGEHLSEATLDGKIIPGYFEDQGFGFLYLPVLERKKYKLSYKTGASFLEHSVWNDDTYNVYSVEKKNDVLEVVLRVYGTQQVKVRSGSVKQVVSESNGLIIHNSSYDQQAQLFVVEVTATDMQGTTGKLRLEMVAG